MNPRTFLPLWLLALSMGYAGEPAQTRAFAEARAARLSGLGYHLSLTLDGDSDGYDGQVTLRFELGDPAGDLAVDFMGEKVVSFHVGDRQVSDFTVTPGRINLPARHLRKGPTEWVIRFRGRYSSNGSGFRRFVDPADDRVYLFTDLEPYRAHHFFPCFDQPNLKAVLDLEVRAPSRWSLIANEPIDKHRLEGDRQHVLFKPTPPLPTYLYLLAAGRYAEVHHDGFRVPMAIHCRQSQRKHLDAEAIFSKAQAGLVFFESWFGSPYPFSKYDHVFAPGQPWGSMENPGAVILGERFLVAKTKPRRDLMILHEMAHMWIGNKVTPAWWDDLWLSESAADYLMSLAILELGDKESWRYQGRMIERSMVRDSNESTHPVFARAQDINTAKSLFDEITYGKGFVVLGQLANELGIQTFRQGMRLFIERHGWDNANRDQFVTVMEEVSGRSLADWKRQWFTSTGVNSLHLQYTVHDGLIQDTKLLQDPDNQAHLLRNHRLELALFTAGEAGPATCNETLVLDIKAGMQALPALSGRTAPSFILPDPYDRAYVRVNLDARSLAWVRDFFPRITQPRMRYRVWRILWDMMESGELSARDVLEMGLTHAPTELDPLILKRILTDLKTIVTDYISDEEAQSMHANRLFELAMDQTLSANSGSPRQKTWFSTLFSVATTWEQLNQLYRFYSCKHSPSFDLEKRWRFCAKLSGMGPLAKFLVNDLSKNDKSERGLDFLLYLEALKPEPAAKKAAWERLTGQSLSRSGWRLLASGFHDPSQPELTRPYIKPFFDRLARIYREKGWYGAASFARGLFPKHGTKQVIAECRAFLAAEKDPTLRTLIREYLEDLEHRNAIRARGRSSFKLVPASVKPAVHPR